MHSSSLRKMKAFRDKYLTGKENINIKIFDLGSADIGGSYRHIFDSPQWEYTGLDLLPGNNVDIVLSDPYNWLEIDSNIADIFISGQTFEHIEYFWKTILEVKRIMKPGGLCCIIAPSGGPEHRYPVDCWRFYPDGFKALACYAGLEALEVRTQWKPEEPVDAIEKWADTLLIAKKPDMPSQHQDEAPNIYRGPINFETENALKKIVTLIDTGTTVLELGPATGYVTEYMQKNLNCTVDCVEISLEMAKEARRFCRNMVIADLNNIDFQQYFNKNSYDCILITDVLEHLYAHKRVLSECLPLLKEDGKIIISVPNVAHASIIGCLLKGKFEYRNDGLLDRTHIRFFTKESISNLIAKNGLFIEKMLTVNKLPEDTEIGDSFSDLSVELQKAILNRENALVYQFIFVCRKNGTKHVNAENLPQTPAIEQAHMMRLNMRISELENELNLCRIKSSEHLKDIEVCRNQINRLDAELKNCQAVIGRIQQHPGYRLYKTIKEWIRKLSQ